MAAVLIGDSSKEETDVRDRPIYIQLRDRDDLSNSFWYVIEEKDVDLIPMTKVEEEEEEILGKKKKDDDDDRNNNNIYPETDKIRELPLPRIIGLSDSIVVSRSRIFILGGYLIEDSDGCHGYARPDFSKNFFYIEADNPAKSWLKGPTLNQSRGVQSVAALEKSGLIVACGYIRGALDSLAEFLHDSLSGTWWRAPTIPGEDCFEIKKTRLLAVTDTKVYMYDFGDRNRKGVGLSFEVQNSQWNIFDFNFSSIWFPSGPGVVLDFNSNSYLFIFAKNGARSVAPEEFCVYNLKTSTWLPLPVKGLPKDDKFLPRDEYFVYSGPKPKYLLRMNQKNKLALVWSILPSPVVDDHEFRTKIQCTKFIISCTFDRRSQHPIFHANIVSFGSFDVKGGIKMWNCAA